MDSERESLVPARRPSAPSFLSIKEGDESAFVSVIEPAGLSAYHGSESDQMDNSLQKNEQEPCKVVVTDCTDTTADEQSTLVTRIQTETRADAEDEQNMAKSSIPSMQCQNNCSSSTKTAMVIDDRRSTRAVVTDDTTDLYEREQSISQTKPVYLFYIISMILSVAAMVMGFLFTKQCPVAPELPLLIFIMGVAGTLSLIFKITDLVHDKLYLRTQSDNNLFYEVACFVGYFIVTILLLAEISLVMQTDPSNIALSRQYCHPMLYNFAYWTNWVGLIFTIIAAGIHGPGLICKRNRRRSSSVP